MKFFRSGNGVLVALNKFEGEELLPNSVEASLEKHIPEVELQEKEILVKVGSVAHPMIEAHYIESIVVEYDDFVEIKYLHPGELPEAKFARKEKDPVAVYAYCNLHGLWKK